MTHNNNSQFNFEVLKRSSKSRARLGKITTPHGDIQTPSFIFCATKASIKGVTTQQVEEAGTQIILSNTYHLMLQPGEEIVKNAGKLHKFMNWNKPMLTDSGGFQIFSLGHGSVAQEIKGRRFTSEARNKTLLKITEEGAIFRAYTDGRKHLLTPERSIQVQQTLGADLIVVLDECTPFHVSKHYTRKSMEMSHRWGQRSYEEFTRTNDGSQALYGIIQGGIYEDLRKESCDFVNSLPFFGHAIGGSLGENKDQMKEVVDYAAKLLDERRPIHLLGIGGISDIFYGVKAGIDTFDCVHPTRLARHGGALAKRKQSTDKEHINIRNSQYRFDTTPIESDCSCHTCKNYTKSYLHHLLKAQELLALTLISIHNIAFMNRLLAAIRGAIETDSLDELQKEWLLD